MIDITQPLSLSLNSWIFFTFFISALLILDFIRFYLYPHVMTIKEACWTSFCWIALAFIFNGWIYFQFGLNPALQFLTGYLLEESLSLDNLFVFLLIFKHFKVPQESKHGLLFYGIVGAVLMRGLLIWAGITLIEKVDWIFIFFGLFLMITGIKLAFQKKQEEEKKEGFLYRFLTKWIPFDSSDKSGSFIIKKGKTWIATPLLIVLILIELTDLIFALDSIPAILGITTDPFIVYSSNVFAILGLRSLFFALENLMNKFYLLHYALAFILTFIGFKMLIAPYFHFSVFITLFVILSSLTASLIVSFLTNPKNPNLK